LLLAGTGVQRLGAQALESEVAYSARDSIRYDLGAQEVHLFGAATVTYEGVQLSAERIIFSFKNEEAHAFGAPDSTGAEQGKPRFTQEGHSFDADSIRYSFRSKTGLIRDVTTQEQETWVHARLSKRHPDGEVHSTGGMLTTCDRPRPHYHFRVGRMMVLPDDKIVTGPAFMKVGPVPTPLAVPFGLFPNKKGRSSGVLIPVWGNSDQLGYFLLNGGYYLPLSDHADLQLTGDIYSRGSWAARAQARYRTRYRYTGHLDISRSTQLNSDPEFPDFSRLNNFFVRWDHQVDSRASLTDRFSASVNVGTSQNFSNNFNSNLNDYLSNTFQSNIAWTHLWPGRPFNLSANLRHSQNTLNRTFDLTLPALTFNLQRILPVQLLRPAGAAPRWYDQLSVNYTAYFENRLSTTEDRIALDNLAYLAGQMRNGVRHTANVGTTLKNRFFSLNPEFRATDRMYFSRLRKGLVTEGDSSFVRTDTVPTFGAPFEWSAGATLTSKLYFMYSYRSKRLRAIRHVMTPTASFNYRPDQSTEITGPYGPGGTQGSYSPWDTGIFGKPAAGRSSTLALGLINNVEAKVLDRKAPPDSTGRAEETYKKVKLLDFVGINTNYDLLADSLNWSPVNVSARTTLFNALNVNVTSLWDPYAVNGLGQRINTSEYAATGRLARMAYTNVALGFDLKSKRYGQPAGTARDDAGERQVVEDSDPNKGARINFSMPWHLNVNYSYDVNRSYVGGAHQDTERQSVIFNGDVNILKHWKLGVSSGYDLTNEDWTPTTLNLYWDLHCWEFNFNIIPIGVRKSFMFRINVKASVLRDLKFEQRRPYGGAGDLMY
jgi:lipopolysaccharide assembly outer membrane protein LptD (OstA)